VTDDEKRAHEEQLLAGDPAVAGAVHAVDQMMAVVDDLETYVWTTHWRERNGTRYRLNLLWLHAGAALVMAPLLSATGPDGLTGPSFAFLRELPGTPYSLATILGLGGLVLGWGCIFRHKTTEMVGLALLAVFYLIVGVSFAVPPIEWLIERGPVKPPSYSPILYAHLALIMVAHIRGLIFARQDLAAIAAISRGFRPGPGPINQLPPPEGPPR